MPIKKKFKMKNDLFLVAFTEKVYRAAYKSAYKTISGKSPNKAQVDEAVRNADIHVVKKINKPKK